ncbi:carboxypeptidase [Stachybotrys elegans]|uniref:Carboxypeptidase n=1 Tax=Stachybotrys elegans TaxID=80388 RepID=A0A8K0SI22_9HYPO|nr:carboxypeptidase [Stachybotrys elegans]
MKQNANLLSAALLCAHGVVAQSGGPHGGVPFPKLGWNHQPVDQDSEAIARNFPDVDLELLSPAFINPELVRDGFDNGTSNPTSHKDMDYFLQTLSERNDWINYDVPSFLSEEGRTLPFLFLSNRETYSNAAKLRVYIQGAIHGNEPSADQGIMALLGKMDSNLTWTANLLERMDILVLTRYNPDGVHYFQRELASNIDPNREHTKLIKEQSRNIKRKVSAWQPHIVLDVHEFAAHNVFGGVYRHGLDAMIATGGDLNTHRDIRNLSETLFVDSMEELLESRGLRAGPYVLGDTSDEVGSPILFEESITSPASGTNAAGLAQAVSILLETRGQFLASQHYQRRVATQLTMLEAVLNTAYTHSDYIYETINNAIDEFISSNDDIILSDVPVATNRTFPLVDIRNGTLQHVEVGFLSTTPTEPEATRARPEAYLIPRNWYELADKLRIMGVEVEELTHEYRGTVTAYNITSSELDTSLYEGVVRSHVTTAPVEREIRLRPGSFRVSTRQKNAAYAFVTLEPESPVSFVTFGFFPLSTGYEYPIFREEREER